jgi:hypothetical protein
MIMPTFNLVLVIWALVGPAVAGGVTWAAMYAQQKIVVAGAVRVARGDEILKCNAQRAAIAETINATARRSISDAWEAASNVTATPEVPAEIAALCKASASCRDRGSP